MLQRKPAHASAFATQMMRADWIDHGQGWYFD